MTRRLALLPTLTLLAALAGCSGDDSSTNADPPPASHSTPTAASTSPPASSPATTTPTTAPPRSTPKLDSVAVIGHSGATGYNSDPNQPDEDVLANSWATGTNPAVDSIYARLSATHPALRGHAYNYAIDGSDVKALPNQIAKMLASSSPLPDLVIIQSIDNDIRCDGSDGSNYAPFAQALDAATTSIEEADAGVHIYLPDQAADEARYARALAADPDLVRANTGSGPCDLFTATGKLRDGAVRYYQRVEDTYVAKIDAVCSRHAGCATDGRRLQQLNVVRADLADDGNHFVVQGLAKVAALSWKAMPARFKRAP